MFYLVPLCFLLFSFSASSVELILIGSVHQENEHYSESALFHAIKKINPDIILTEGDSSMFDEKGKVKPELNFLEANVYVTLQSNNELPVLNISMPNRNEKMNNLNYHQTLNTGFSIIQNRFNEGKLHFYDKFEKVLATFTDRNKCINNSNLNEMNSEFCFRAMKSNYQGIFRDMTQVIGAEPDLESLHKSWLDIVSFHELRDSSMAVNALDIVKKTKKQRYVVVVGTMHMPVVYEKLQALFGEKAQVLTLNESLSVTSENRINIVD